MSPIHKPGQDQPGCPRIATSASTSRAGPVANGNTVTVHFTGPAPYAAWQTTSGTSPSYPIRVVEVVGYGPGHRGQHQPREHRADDTGPRWLQPDGSLLPGQPPLVGVGAVGPVVPLQVPVRCGERFEQCRIIGIAEQQHRLEQQLPAGHQYPDDHRWQQLHPDVLPVGSLHAVGQHGLARAEHFESADEQR